MWHNFIITPSSWRDVWQRPPALARPFNTWDLLKFLALALMIIDHVGAFFMDNNEIWRAIGRGSAPLWFFLIGYAPRQRVDVALVTAAAVLTIGQLYFGRALLPVHILWVFIAWRAVLFLADTHPQLAQRWGWLAALALLLLDPIIAPYWSYGTLGLVFAWLGFARSRGQIDGQNFLLLLGIVLACYVITESLYSQFTTTGFYVTALLALAIMPMVAQFRLGAVAGWPRWLQAVIMTSARHSLWIYTLHLLLFYSLV